MCGGALLELIARGLRVFGKRQPGSGFASRLEMLDGLSRCDVGNPLILAQWQHMALVPRSDHVGAAGQRRGQHMIVIGIRGHHPRRCRR